ncbi:MAG: flagellin [Lachnospiraceae bacterium]|nr:flagellin [Lachnospiraceae bacterium]
MRINYNISSMIARNALNNNDDRLTASMQRLSSGLKINGAVDNPAGLAIARRMNAQIEGLKQANNNANDGLSVVNTADGAMSEMHSILQRMSELSIQAANGTNADTDREQIQMEIDQLINEIDRIAKTTEFNAQNLLDGSFAYKAYTNNENIKVKACGDGVVNGNYMINSISYSHHASKITTYDKDGNIEKVEDDESYKFNSEDSIRNSLVTTSSIAKNAGTYPKDLKGFPEGSNVSIDNSIITIKADDNFELKLDVNNRKLNNQSVSANSIVSTSTVTKYAVTDTYRNIIIMDKDKNARYNISELSLYYENANGLDSFKRPGGTDGNYNSYNSSKTFSGSEEEKFKKIGEDLKDFFNDKHPDCEIEVTNVSYDSTANGLKIDYTYKNTKNPTPGGATADTFTFSLNTEKDPNVTNKKLDDFLYQKSETVINDYKIGDPASQNENKSIMLDVTGAGAMRLQVGANEGQVIAIDIPNLDAESLGVAGLDITTEDKATAAIDRIGDAINQLSAVRAKIGAYANRIEHTITNLDTTEENMTASYSQIMDVDMAKEMTEYSTVQVLVQASTSVLAQANERPQQVLQLLQ